MNSSPSPHARHDRIRYAHELLFSLNVAITFMLVRVALTPSPAFPMSAFWQIKWRVNVHFQQHADSELGTRVAFLALTIAFTICVYLFLRLASRMRSGDEFLRSGAGILAVVTPFFSWYYIIGWSFFMQWQVFAAVEFVLSGIGAFYYLHSRRQIATWVNLLTLALHCAFWCWYFLLGFESQQVLINPTISCTSVFMWGAYVRKLRRNRAAGSVVAVTLV